MQRDNINSILIVKLSAIGDAVHTIPLLEVLRDNFPEARIDWLIEEEASQMIIGHSALNRVIISRRKAWQKSLFNPSDTSKVLKEIGGFLKELRSYRYDIVIDLQGLFKSGILTGLSKGKRKIGFTGCREGSSLFLTEKPYPFDYETHALDRYLTAALRLGCRINSWEGKIPVTEKDIRSIDTLLEEENIESDNIIAINPMARWKTKLWYPERFAELADRLQQELGCRVLFTGGAQDREVIRVIQENMAATAIDLTGRTSLKGLAYLYSMSRLLITTDTGPMHIAAAMGCRVIALFGPTAPWRTGPYGDIHHVIRDEIDCSPCFQKKCSDLKCMRNITVEKVFDVVKSIL